MMKKESVSGKLIRLFLVDENPKGLRTVEISNMTIYATIFPRTKLKDFFNRKESNKPGSYILLGNSLRETGETIAYIGEGNPVKERLKTHASGELQKDVWEEVVVFTSKDDYITKTQIQYLESELYRLASEAGKVELTNNQKPSKPNLSEVDNSEMGHFLEAIKLILLSLGIDILESQRITTGKEIDKKEMIYEFTIKGQKARMKIDEDKHIVLKGSTAVLENRPSAGQPIIKMRESLKDRGVMEIDNDKARYLFKEDYIFTSPSYAAAAISGGEENGRAQWKYKGKSLNELELEEIEKATNKGL